ncbi:MAG: PorT family protein [Saprospiraceae bacterium]|nr:PorT family protein [Saprospiraceae bacterium]
MKKSILFLLCLTAGLALQAQVKLGLRLGVATTSLNEEDLSSLNELDVALKDASYGVNGGLVLQINLGNFIIQPEVLFNSSQVDYNVSDVGNGIVDSLFKEKFQNLDIPILLGYKLGGFLRLHAGPVGHVLINSTSELTDIQGYKEKFNNFTWGWQAGFGVDIGKLMIDMRYEGNFNKYGDHFEFFGTEYEFDQAPARFLVSVGYLF